MDTKIVSAIEELRTRCGKKKIKVEEPPKNFELEQEIHQWLKDKVEPVLFNPIKQERREGIIKVEEELLSYIKEKYGEEKYIELANRRRKFSKKLSETPFADR
jgi:polyribonucleotide nucleotidyltransferase